MRQNLQCFRFFEQYLPCVVFMAGFCGTLKTGCFFGFIMLQYLSVTNKCPHIGHMRRQMSLKEIQTVKMAETGKGMAVIWERQQDILLLSRKQCRRFC